MFFLANKIIHKSGKINELPDNNVIISIISRLHIYF
jgi:hypothetical protein